MARLPVGPEPGGPLKLPAHLGHPDAFQPLAVAVDGDRADGALLEVVVLSAIVDEADVLGNLLVPVEAVAVPAGVRVGEHMRNAVRAREPAAGGGVAVGDEPADSAVGHEAEVRGARGVAVHLAVVRCRAVVHAVEVAFRRAYGRDRRHDGEVDPRDRADVPAAARHPHRADARRALRRVRRRAHENAARPPRAEAARRIEAQPLPAERRHRRAVRAHLRLLRREVAERRVDELESLRQRHLDRVAILIQLRVRPLVEVEHQRGDLPVRDGERVAELVHRRQLHPERRRIGQAHDREILERESGAFL